MADTGALATINTRTTNFMQSAKQANGYGQAAGSVAPSPYKPSSVLNPPTSSGIGLSAPDKERAIYGTPSPNGQSEMTADQTLRLRFHNPNINI